MWNEVILAFGESVTFGTSFEGSDQLGPIYGENFPCWVARAILLEAWMVAVPPTSCIVGLSGEIWTLVLATAHVAEREGHGLDRNFPSDCQDGLYYGGGAHNASHIVPGTVLLPL